MSSNLQELEARAEAYTDEPEECWKPAPGEQISGKIVSIETRGSEHDPEVPVVLLKTGGGHIVSVWAFWTVLRGELLKARAQPDDEIVIKRLQDSDRGYRRYRVFSNKTPSNFNWAGMNPDAGDIDPQARRDREMEMLLGEKEPKKEVPLSQPDDDLEF